MSGQFLVVGSYLHNKPTKQFTQFINRESYMSAHVLLNLLNEFGKRDQMRGLQIILYFFCNKFNKFNNTRA